MTLSSEQRREIGQRLKAARQAKNKEREMARSSSGPAYDREAEELAKQAGEATGPAPATLPPIPPNETPAQTKARILEREFGANRKINPASPSPSPSGAVGYRVKGVTCGCGVDMELQSSKRIAQTAGGVVLRLKYECVGTGAKAGCGRWVALNAQEVGG